MSVCESLFVEAWKAGIELSVNGDKLHLEANQEPSEDFMTRLKAHKPELLRFLSCWIDTPFGEAKVWHFFSNRRCAVVLRNRPDRVTWMKRCDLGGKPSVEDKAAAVQ